MSEVNGNQWSAAAEINVKSSAILNVKDHDKLGLSVFPIPFTDSLTININKLKSVANEKIKVKILNINGSEVFSNSFNTRDNININTSKFATGIYIVKVTHGELESTLKVVKGNVLLKEEDE